MSLFHYSEATTEEIQNIVSLANACDLTQQQIEELTEEEYSEFLSCCVLYDV
tara:strand:+ start:280 stop:435 length:156 start_codon:yes stop_codon:yes gene_type:complete